MRILLLLTLILSTACAHVQHTTNDYAQISKQVSKFGKKYGVDQVLVVLDIDNTVLKMPQHLGSDQWWGWQSACIGKTPKPNHCYTTNFSELLNLQGELFAMSKMVPTQESTVSTIKSFQDKGYKVILLTSRGPAFRSATEKEINANGLSFIDSAIGPKGGYAASFKPYSLSDFSKYGLDAKDIELMGNKKARMTSYQNGIFMTAGLNKGIMLKTLLHKTNSSFKAIVFADDHEKHTIRMDQIISRMGVDLKTYRYSAVDSEVKAFKSMDKTKVIEALNKYIQTKSSILK